MTIACESIVALMALVIVTKGQRLEYFFKGLAVVPLRYALVVCELVTLGAICRGSLDHEKQEMAQMTRLLLTIIALCVVGWSGRRANLRAASRSRGRRRGTLGGCSHHLPK